MNVSFCDTFGTSKLHPTKSDKFSNEKMELAKQLEDKKKEVQEKQKLILDLQGKVRNVSQLETQLEDTSRKLEASNKERDKLEREVAGLRLESAAFKRTLDLEHQERKELETRALALIKDAQRKWKNSETDKIAQLNKHIESQTVRITELCTNNNEMSSRLQRTECELQTATAELQKLRAFQVQYKESLAKTRELSRQSVQGVEIKLEEISARAHNQLSELRAKLDFETARNNDLETKLRHEEDSNHCRQSRLNVAFEITQNELKDCQEQLRTLQASIPVRDAEIETLRNQLQERSNQLDNVAATEQTVTALQEQLERLQLENQQLTEQLQVTKSDLNETMINLEQSETLAVNLERITQDKAALQLRLQHSVEKEEEHLRKVGNLEELLKRLEHSVTKLEAENASLKHTGQEQPRNTLYPNKNISEASTYLQEQVQRLEQQLETAKENLNSERQTAKQAKMTLWKKEKELSDVNLDKRIAVREGKKAEEKVKMLQDEKQKLFEKLNNKTKEEEEKSVRLLKELDNAKGSLNEVTKEASRNKLQADSAQRALTQANHQIEELQSSTASLRRELDATRKQMRTNQDRVDNLNVENRRLSQTISRYNEERNEVDCKIEKLEQDVDSYKLNIELLKETCTVLEEQLTDYEKLTSDHETRANILIQDKMKLQKDLGAVEAKLREARVAQNEEKTLRLVAERNVERLESETSDIETERSGLITQRDRYKKLTQELNMQVENLSASYNELECDMSEMRRALEAAKEEARIVKEESSEHLTRLHEVKEMNSALMIDLQNSIDQSQELRLRIAELENVLEEMRQFYQEREVKAEGTRQQQTKLIDYLQLKLEECSKKKKTVCDKILGTKQKENVPPIATSMPVGYRELENQLTKERAKVKTLTDQLLILKATHASASAPSSPPSPNIKKLSAYSAEIPGDQITKRLSPQRIGHHIPHRFNIGLPMRAGKCSACLESIQFGKRAAICNDCQIMTHLKCSLSVPATCGLQGSFTKQFSKPLDSSEESLSSIGGSVQTLALDQPDKPETVQDCKSNNDKILMESWVKVPGRAKACWERKYLRLEGTQLCTYEHQPCTGMAPINRLDLNQQTGFTVIDTVQQADVINTAKSDIPFIFCIESNSLTTCWPTSRLDIMCLSQTDKKNWLKALTSITSQHGSGKATKTDKYQTVLKLEKHQLDLNCAVELAEENILLLAAEEGLFSYFPSKSQTLTPIRGVKRVHQLSLYPHLSIALMIAGESRQLVSCSLRQLKSNAAAAECSRPAVNTKSVLIGSESCHLYQVQNDILCAATASHVILLRWVNGEDSGEFIAVRELETQEPCSCAIFTKKILIVGCNKFYQIDLKTYCTDEFPEEDDSSVKAALTGVARLGIFPVAVLQVSSKSDVVELLLCYNEFGVFVNERGQRTRSVDPTWNHLPFAFAFRKPYLYIIHFSSVEIVRIDLDTYTSLSKSPVRILIDLSAPRFLGVTSSRGIYVATVNSFLELVKIEGSSQSELSGSLTSLDTVPQDDDNSSEFSFTSSLMEVLDGQGKKVHFMGVPKY